MLTTEAQALSIKRANKTVEPLSQARRSGITHHDLTMRFVSLSSPSLVTDRLLATVAKADISSFQQYDRRVRGFDQNPRDVHYSMLFDGVNYSQIKMAQLPNFEPCDRYITQRVER